MRRYLALAVVFGTACLAGCGTLDNVSDWDDCRIYGGTTSNLSTISGYRSALADVERIERDASASKEEAASADAARGGALGSYGHWALLAKFDLPFTIIGDTVTLPYTVLNAVGRPIASLLFGGGKGDLRDRKITMGRPSLSRDSR